MALLRQCLRELRLKRDDWDIADNTWPERATKNDETCVLRRSPGMREPRGVGAPPPRADALVLAVHG